MPPCEKISLDDAEAAQIKLYPLLLAIYSQFALLAVPFLVSLAAALPLFIVGLFRGGALDVLSALLKSALFFAPFVVLAVPNLPFAPPELQTRKARWIAAGVVAVVMAYAAGFGIITAWIFLALPLAQASLVVRLRHRPILAVAIVCWVLIAILGLAVLLYASEVDVRRGELLVIVLGLVPSGAFLWSLSARYLFISRISDQTRSLLCGHFSSVLSWEALATFTGVPLVWNRLRSNKALTLASFLLASFFGGLMLVAGLTTLTIITRLHKFPLEYAPYAFFIPLAVFVISAGLMHVCDRLARAKTRISADELISADPRPPILFLRAFKDDQVGLPAAGLGFLGTALSLGRHHKSFDELLLEEGTIYGPVVALGNPNDRVPPYGVARGYFQNADWKKAVSDLARASQLIVLTLHDTEAVWWEVAHVVEREYAHKTLFVLPPNDRGAGPGASPLSRLIRHLPALPEATQRELAEADARRDTIAVAINPDGSASIVRSGTFSSFAYLMLLRWFMRSRLQESVAPAAAAQAQASAYAGAQSAFAGAAAGAAGGTASFYTAAAAPPAGREEREPVAPSEPAWIKAVRVAGARMGLLGGLLVILIEGLRVMVRRLAPKVGAVAKDSMERVSKHAAAARASAGVALSAQAWPSFAVGERVHRFADLLRNLSWPAWVTSKGAIGAGGVAILVLLVWAGPRPSSNATTTPFTPGSYTTTPTPSAPAPTSRVPESSEPRPTVGAYEQLYRDGYVFDPDRVATPAVSDEPCLTSWLNASLVDNQREKRRLSYQVVKDCTRAIRNNPRYATALMARGQAYKNLGQTAAAIADFRKGLALDPTLPISTDLAELESRQPARKNRQRY